ncbi:MAG: transglycosylase SLT domain-containing protein [Actinomycetota bacterium]|nr:transglycosylase SLT domain-containing protein [Actinomycetota bacterium]
MIGVASLIAVVASGSAAGRIHTVKAGDTLDGLSRRYGVPVPALAQANGIADPDHILAGSKLTLPAPGAPSLPEARVATQPVAKMTPVAATPASTRARAIKMPPSRAGLRPVFAQFSRTAGVPTDLVMALAWQESGWQVHKVSSTRAVGVMQLMPDTVEFVSRILLRQRQNLDPHDPGANIRMGTRFLRYLLDRTGGDLDTALASYYQGLRSVRERGVFPETHRFVANVKALRPRF